MIPSITVVICTYNRCHLLAEALESIAASIVPENVEWEILVVDNHSNDSTREIVEGYLRRYPDRFRYLLEQQQGLSFARNAGVLESRGEIIAFTDDDVRVEPSWLWNLTESLRSGEWAGAGGRIIPVWNRTLPRWLRPDGIVLSGPFVALDLGPVPIPLTQAPVGANMAFRKEVFVKVGAFRTDLGRVGEGANGACEDSEFGERLLLAGEQLRYEPLAVVYHPVPPERLKKAYLLSWFFGHGYSQALMYGIPPETKWLVAGVPLHLVRREVRWSFQWFFTLEPAKRFQNKLNAWEVAGAIGASFQLSRGLRKRVFASAPVEAATKSVKLETLPKMAGATVNNSSTEPS